MKLIKDWNFVIFYPLYLGCLKKCLKYHLITHLFFFFLNKRTQFKRGGLSLCLKNELVAKAFRNLFSGRKTKKIHKKRQDKLN